MVGQPLIPPGANGFCIRADVAKHLFPNFLHLVTRSKLHPSLYCERRFQTDDACINDFAEIDRAITGFQADFDATVQPAQGIGEKWATGHSELDIQPFQLVMIAT